MNIEFVRVFTPILFSFFLIISLIIGWLGGWKKALYYGIFNLVILAIFAIIVRVNPNIFANFANQIAGLYKGNYGVFVQAGAALTTSFAATILYFVFFVVLNILLVVIHLIFFRKKLRKNKAVRLHSWKRNLAAAFLQLTLWLPMSFTFSGSFASTTATSLSVKEVLSDLKRKNVNDSQFNKFLAKSVAILKPYYLPWSQIKLLGNTEYDYTRIISAINLHLYKDGVVQKFSKVGVEMKNLFKDFQTDNNTTASDQIDLNNLVKEIQEILKKNEEKEKQTSKVKKLTKQQNLKTQKALDSNELTKNTVNELIDTVRVQIAENNPNLPKTVKNVNVVYESSETQVYFSWISNVFSNLSADQLKTLINLFNKFGLENQIKRFVDKVLTVKSSQAIKFISEQLKAFVKYKTKDLSFASAQRIKVSQTFKTYFADCFTDLLLNLNSNEKEITRSDWFNLSNAVLDVMVQVAR